MSSKVTFLEVADEDAGQRLDNWLLRHLKGVPRTRIYRLVRKGEVRVNKSRTRPDYRVNGGDLVRIPPVRLPEPSAAYKPNKALVEQIGQSIVYEDDSLLVINKPAGIAVHGGSGLSGGVIEILRYMRPDLQSVELVHRLDRETSGVLLLAKKRSALRRLHQALRDKTVRKHYLALVEGSWPSRKRVVAVPLQKNVLQSGERMVRALADGKPSETRFTLLGRGEGVSLVLAEPVTGRTHQIRVHCQYAGHPIIGDEKYGRDEVNQAFRQKGIRRLCLHAREIAFDLDGAHVFEAEPDESLKLALSLVEEGRNA